jgi:hypothetical protein
LISFLILKSSMARSSADRAAASSSAICVVESEARYAARVACLRFVGPVCESRLPAHSSRNAATQQATAELPV